VGTESDRRADRELAPLRPIALHECPHTAPSLLIAAGVNVKTVSAVMGRASVTITVDRYGHLLPDSVAEAGSCLPRGSRGTENRLRVDRAAQLLTIPQSVRITSACAHRRHFNSQLPGRATGRDDRARGRGADHPIRPKRLRKKPHP
jgi:hypothetical protein